MPTCVRCDSPASIQVTNVVNGQASDMFFCQDCAPTVMLVQHDAGKEKAKLLKAFDPFQAGLMLRRGVDPTLACPECGTTFARFRETGRFGCAHDYKAFGAHIGALLQSIHKARSYTGKVPGGERQVREGVLLDELMLTQEALERAIEREDYEEAARLRDQIRRLNRKPGERGSEA